MQNPLQADILKTLSLTSNPNSLACGSLMFGHILAEENRLFSVSVEICPKYCGTDHFELPNIFNQFDFMRILNEMARYLFDYFPYLTLI